MKRPYWYGVTTGWCGCFVLWMADTGHPVAATVATATLVLNLLIDQRLLGTEGGPR